jgi:hypothetical protein
LLAAFFPLKVRADHCPAPGLMRDDKINECLVIGIAASQPALSKIGLNGVKLLKRHILAENDINPKMANNSIQPISP